MKSPPPKFNGITPKKEENTTTTDPQYRTRSCIFLIHQRHSSTRRKFTSVDPAPASSNLLRGPPKPDDLSTHSIENLQNKLNNEYLPLFERYRAMFALRNIGTDAAVDALASGFADNSELFKYVRDCSSTDNILIYRLTFTDTKLLSYLANFFLHIPFLHYLRSLRTRRNRIWSDTKRLRPWAV